jgi:hypothetical protein
MKALMDSLVVFFGAGEFTEHMRHLEGQCDRASIYMFETVLKILSIQRLFKLDIITTTVGHYKIIGFMYQLDDAWRAGKLGQLLETEEFEKILADYNITDIKAFGTDIAKSFEDVETIHPYLKGPRGEGLQDPGLIAQERVYFRRAFDFLRFFDSKGPSGKLGRFDKDHFQNSRFIRVTRALVGLVGS